MSRRKWIMETILLLLFILFVYTAGSKLINYKTTVFQMNAQPFDNKYTPFLVLGVPIAEFIVAGMLIFKRTLLKGLWASLFLLTLFTGYIILIKLNYYGTIPCSCGGVLKDLTWTKHLFFNLFFMAISIAGILIEKRNLQSRQYNMLSWS
jgi:putative oxidoreductase